MRAGAPNGRAMKLLQRSLVAALAVALVAGGFGTRSASAQFSLPGALDPKRAALGAAAKQLDDEFHTLLIASCPNRRLLEMLASVQRSMARYERAYMSDAHDVARSARQHADMIASLRAGDLDAAVATLRDHWDYGAERLIQTLGEVF